LRRQRRVSNDDLDLARFAGDVDRRLGIGQGDDHLTFARFAPAEIHTRDLRFALNLAHGVRDLSWGAAPSCRRWNAFRGIGADGQEQRVVFDPRFVRDKAVEVHDHTRAIFRFDDGYLARVADAEAVVLRIELADHAWQIERDSRRRLDRVALRLR